MTKEITLDLFARLDDVSAPAAIADDLNHLKACDKKDIVRRAVINAERITIRSGRCALKIAKVAERIDEVKSTLKNCHRKGVTARETRKFPEYVPGMSVAMYICEFQKVNGRGFTVLPFDLSAYVHDSGLYDGRAIDFDVSVEDEETPLVAEPTPEPIDLPINQAQATPTPELAPEPEPTPFALLLRAARSARVIAKEAMDKARASSAKTIGDAATDDNPYPYLKRVDGRRGGTDAAVNIRLVLKNEFPGVRFHVKSDYGSVDIYWTDGPTNDAVSIALSMFHIGHSDSQTDYFYTTKTRFSEIFGGVQYLFTHRELSEESVMKSMREIFGENGPTYDEWKAGTDWRKIESKGRWGDSVPGCSYYDWADIVRRHANGQRG